MARLVLSGQLNKAGGVMLSELHRRCRRGKLMLFVGRCAVTVLIALLPAATAFSQSDSVDRGISANDLARAVVANELKSQDANHSRWMYHLDRDEQGKKKAKEVVQTGQGSLDRLVALDGRPLTANEQQQENKRIESLVKNPQEQQRLEQTKRKDAEQCKAFFKMIPNAFTFSYAGREGDLIALSYKPNPNFQPPSREARVFHEMEGEMWVHETPRALPSSERRPMTKTLRWLSLPHTH